MKRLWLGVAAGIAALAVMVLPTTPATTVVTRPLGGDQAVSAQYRICGYRCWTTYECGWRWVWGEPFPRYDCYDRTRCVPVECVVALPERRIGPAGEVAA